MDIFKYPLALIPVIQRFPLGPKWPRPLAVHLQNGAPTLWVALREDEVDVDLCVRIFPTGAGLDRIDLDTYVGTWAYQDGTIWHIFAWGEVAKVRENQS